MIKTSNGKYYFNLKNIKIKSFLNDKESEKDLLYNKNQSQSKKEPYNIISRNNSKKFLNHKNGLQTPINKSNFIFNNTSKNRQRKSIYNEKKI